MAERSKHKPKRLWSNRIYKNIQNLDYSYMLMVTKSIIFIHPSKYMVGNAFINGISVLCTHLSTIYMKEENEAYWSSLIEFGPMRKWPEAQKS